MHTEMVLNENGRSSGPQFSVIIATFNYGHLIHRAIDSLRNQTFNDFEIIVVDDGSTDGTKEALSPVFDLIKYYYQENQGQSVAYNRGVQLSRGRFVLILDADDELQPNALQAFSDAIQQHDTAEDCLYYGGYVSVSEDRVERVRKAKSCPSDPAKRFKAFLKREISGLQNCTTVVPRKIFETIRFPEGLRRNTDIVFYGQALAYLTPVCLPVTVARIHEHPNRVRKGVSNIGVIVDLPVDALFDPAVLPADLMKCRKVFAAYRARSAARAYYVAGAFRDAKRLYWRALKSYPPAMFQVSSMKRFIASLFRA